MYHITFPYQSNRAAWEYTGIITDLDDNPVDISACSMVFAISDKTCGQRLLASTENGKITYLDTGVFRWFFTRDEMAGLVAGSYDTGLTIAPDDDPEDTRQLSVGPVLIVDGVVP